MVVMQVVDGRVEDVIGGEDRAAAEPAASGGHGVRTRLGRGHIGCRRDVGGRDVGGDAVSGLGVRRGVGRHEPVEIGRGIGAGRQIRPCHRVAAAVLGGRSRIAAGEIGCQVTDGEQIRRCGRVGGTVLIGLRDGIADAIRSCVVGWGRGQIRRRVGGRCIFVRRASATTGGGHNQYEGQ
jgi:hypothetical protein